MGKFRKLRFGQAFERGPDANSENSKGADVSPSPTATFATRRAVIPLLTAPGICVMAPLFASLPSGARPSAKQDPAEAACQAIVAQWPKPTFYVGALLQTWKRGMLERLLRSYGSMYRQRTGMAASQNHFVKVAEVILRNPGSPQGLRSWSVDGRGAFDPTKFPTVRRQAMLLELEGASGSIA